MSRGKGDDSVGINELRTVKVRSRRRNQKKKTKQKNDELWHAARRTATITPHSNGGVGVQPKRP